METRTRSHLGTPGRIAVLAAGYSAAVGLTTLAAFLWAPPDAAWVGWLDLEDLFFTTPVAFVLALLCGSIEMARRRSRRGLMIAVAAVALIGLIAFGFMFVGLLGAAGLMDNL